MRRGQLPIRRLRVQRCIAFPAQSLLLSHPLSRIKFRHRGILQCIALDHHHCGKVILGALGQHLGAKQFLDVLRQRPGSLFRGLLSLGQRAIEKALQERIKQPAFFRDKAVQDPIRTEQKTGHRLFGRDEGPARGGGLQGLHTVGRSIGPALTTLRDGFIAAVRILNHGTVVADVSAVEVTAVKNRNGQGGSKVELRSSLLLCQSGYRSLGCKHTAAQQLLQQGGITQGGFFVRQLCQCSLQRVQSGCNGALCAEMRQRAGAHTVGNGGQHNALRENAHGVCILTGDAAPLVAAALCRCRHSGKCTGHRELFRMIRELLCRQSFFFCHKENLHCLIPAGTGGAPALFFCSV